MSVAEIIKRLRAYIQGCQWRLRNNALAGCWHQCVRRLYWRLVQGAALIKEAAAETTVVASLQELAMKAAASKTNKGGGVAGKADRLGGAAGHAKYKCPICAQQGPDMKTMQARCRLLSVVAMLPCV